MQKKRDAPLKDYVFYSENMITDNNYFEKTCVNRGVLI